MRFHRSGAAGRGIVDFVGDGLRTVFSVVSQYLDFTAGLVDHGHRHVVRSVCHGRGTEEHHRQDEIDESHNHLSPEAYPPTTRRPALSNRFPCGGYHRERPSSLPASPYLCCPGIQVGGLRDIGDGQVVPVIAAGLAEDDTSEDEYSDCQTSNLETRVQRPPPTSCVASWGRTSALRFAGDIVTANSGRVLTATVRLAQHAAIRHAQKSMRCASRGCGTVKSDNLEPEIGKNLQHLGCTNPTDRYSATAGIDGTAQWPTSCAAVEPATGPRSHRRKSSSKGARPARRANHGKAG